VIIFPLKRTWPFIWTKSNSFNPRIICTKFDWNWLPGSGKDLKIPIIFCGTYKFVWNLLFSVILYFLRYLQVWVVWLDWTVDTPVWYWVGPSDCSVQCWPSALCVRLR
jgi:hypothetical protein